MAEKKKGTPVSQNRLRAIDDPTAAFPIGALAGLVAELDDASEEGRTPVDDTTGDEGSTSEEVARAPAGPASINASYVVLSLLGGGLLAVMVAAGLGLLLMLV